MHSWGSSGRDSVPVVLFWQRPSGGRRCSGDCGKHAPVDPALAWLVVCPACQLALPIMPLGERSGTEPVAGLAGPGTGACGPIGQAPELQPGPQAGGIGELPPPGGPCQREQHNQARRERGGHRDGHRPGPQPQQAQAQAHQRQHRHSGTATGEPDAAPARDTTGPPAGGAHGASDKARAILDALACPTLPGPAVPPVRWAKTRPDGPAATESWAPPARPARGPLPPAAVHPVTRTAITPSSAPARPDRARTCEALITPSRHGSAGTHLTHRRRDRFHRAYAGIDRGGQHPGLVLPGQPMVLFTVRASGYRSSLTGVARTPATVIVAGLTSSEVSYDGGLHCHTFGTGQLDPVSAALPTAPAGPPATSTGRESPGS
jgi:hypothetical protein